MHVFGTLCSEPQPQSWPSSNLCNFQHLRDRRRDPHGMGQAHPFVYGETMNRAASRDSGRSPLRSNPEWMSVVDEDKYCGYRICTDAYRPRCAVMLA